MTNEYPPFELPDDDALPAAPFETIDAVDILGEPYTPPTFPAAHLIPHREVILVTGDSGAGKTAFLMHACVSIAVGLPVAGRFAVDVYARPILFVNGEMAGDGVRRYLASAVAGVGQPIPRGKLHFEGRDAFANFQLSPESKTALEATIQSVDAGLVIFDTSRALFAAMDENSAADVGETFGWLRALTNRYDLSVIVAHHRRKISATSNSDRECVAGSTALIGAPGCHIVLRSNGGRRLGAIKMDKTRTPVDGVSSGTEWPIEARLEDVEGDAPRSIFIAGEPTTSGAQSAPSVADDMILDKLNASGPMTIDEITQGGGAKKKSLDRLRKEGAVVEVGQKGRAKLYGLPSVHDRPSFDSEGFE